jgi:HK97 family phage portal protein
VLGFGKKETRASLESPSVPVSSENIIKFFGLDALSSSGVTVTIENALGVPAIMAAVQFLSGTIAGLPLNVYEKKDSGREKLKSGLQNIIHDAVNEETTSFDWRKYLMERVLTNGRSLTYIERVNGRITNLFSIDPSKVTIKRSGNTKTYKYSNGTDKDIVYQSSEIIDIPFALASDNLAAISPILNSKDAIGLMIAATNYGAKFFSNGGVPPFVITGKFETGAALNRASNDLQAAIKKSSSENRLALTLPMNHEIKPIGSDPEKSQLVELKRFQIEEIARIYSLPPVFLQDLTHGTFSNTEQQDLHLVKHTLRRWITQIEQELNLKLFGRNNNDVYVEFNVDGLLRGDFTSRMSGYATAVQNAIRTPDEVRAMENLPSMGETADKLHIQGATVPLGSQSMSTTVVNNG